MNKSIVIEELKGDKAMINLLVNLTNERNLVSNELQVLKQKIQDKYPQLRIQNDSLITENSIKDMLLSSNKLFVEFFDGKKNVYIFSIKRGNSIQLKRVIKDSIFKNKVVDFMKLFSQDRGISLQNNIDRYTSLGYYIYKKIIDIEFSENTIIVPDGLFSFIPFEALITEKTSIKNFEKLPYLLNKTIISYAYSAKILIHEDKVNNPPKNELIGFFPIFENNHRSLQELNYTFKEAKSIEKVQKGTFLLGEEASKSMFYKQSAKYSIIHLSTHATAGNYYEPPAIEFYDETMYLPEIYGYNLRTDLLILSACETGLGALRKGEGVMSLARGFSYAGVKNLIVSLWKVNDKSTAKLMSGFYKSYKKNGQKALALYKSKRLYLDDKNISSSKKSPYYWASFIYIGETSSKNSESYNIVWFLLLGIILISAYFLLKNGRFGINN